MSEGNCQLCGKQAELQHSHVLPAFAFRWLRESSGNGHLRNTLAPNKRTQDGEKRYWLCVDCEQLLAIHEKAFAERLFYPYLEGSGKQFPYTKWLMHFCVSVSWRVLRLYFERGDMEKMGEDVLADARRADSAWREYLLGKRRRPGEFQQHILPFDQIGSSTVSLVPHMNRYLMRAIHFDLCHSDRTIFTYAKLGRFIILGFVRETEIGRWKGSRVDCSQGVIRPRRFELPAAFLEYLKDKANTTHEALGSISDRQQEKIEATFRGNIDKYVGSDAFRAMEADVEMFGKDAFTQRKARPA